MFTDPKHCPSWCNPCKGQSHHQDTTAGRILIPEKNINEIHGVEKSKGPNGSPSLLYPLDLLH